MKRNSGFVLVEILIALAILSIVLLSVISGVTSSVYVISGMKNYTNAMLIARSRMNDFLLKNMRGTDIKDEPVKGYNGFQGHQGHEALRAPDDRPRPAQREQDRHHRHLEGARERARI